MNRRQFLNKTSIAAGSSLLLGGGLTSGLALAQESSIGLGLGNGLRGELAPELEFDHWIDRDGNPGSFSVTNLKGKWVFLKFFQNGCPGCHSRGFPTLQAFIERFIDHPDVTIAAIQTAFENYDINSIDAVRELQLRYELPIMMGHDSGESEKNNLPSTMRNYRSGGTPWLVLISPTGIVHYNGFHVESDALIGHVEARLKS